MKFIAMIMAFTLIGAAPKGWVAKSDAPDSVKRLAEAQPKLHADRRKALAAQITGVKEKIKDAKAKKVGKSKRAEDARKAEIEKLDGELNKLEVAFIGIHDSDLLIPDLWLNKGAIGTCAADVIPVKIMGPKRCLAKIAEQTVVLEDFSTDNIVDSEPHPVTYKGAWLVIGTTTIGDTTYYAIKTINLSPWLSYVPP